MISHSVFSLKFMNIKYLKVKIMQTLVFINREDFYDCLNVILAHQLYPSHRLNGGGAQRKWVGLQSSDRLLQIMWLPAKTPLVGGKSGNYQLHRINLFNRMFI